MGRIELEKKERERRDQMQKKRKGRDTDSQNPLQKKKKKNGEREIRRGPLASCIQDTSVPVLFFQPRAANRCLS